MVAPSSSPLLLGLLQGRALSIVVGVLSLPRGWHCPLCAGKTDVGTARKRARMSNYKRPRTHRSQSP